VIWGTTYVAIKVALETVPPFLMGGLRNVIAGGLLAGLFIVRRRPLPPARDWGRLAIIGSLMFGLGNGGVVWARSTCRRAHRGDDRDLAVLDGRGGFDHPRR
jgi:drug/metabolite transporter (DMT)-like permease